MDYPKISIVTPSYNDAQYIERTILSVVGQGYPNLEYIIIDGGSTDGSVDIIKKYSDRITHWVSEKDNGMYHAVQKGFAISTGEIMGWINSDDVLHTGSLFTLGQIFRDAPFVNWLEGYPNTTDEHGRVVFASPPNEVDKLFFYQGKHQHSYKYIQQESTYWRRTLWEKAGGYISNSYRYAGDFELWIRFFQYEKLHTVSAFLGSFRLSNSGQASVEHYSDYVRETFEILSKYPLTKKELSTLRYRNFSDKVKFKVDIWNRRITRLLRLAEPTTVSGKLYFDSKEQTFKIRG